MAKQSTSPPPFRSLSAFYSLGEPVSLFSRESGCCRWKGQSLDEEGVPSSQQLPFPLATVLSFQPPSPFCHSVCPGVPWEQATCLRQVKRGRNWETSGPFDTRVPYPLGSSPLPFHHPLLSVIPSEAEESAVRHSGAPNLPVCNHLPFVILRAWENFEEKIPQVSAYDGAKPPSAFSANDPQPKPLARVTPIHEQRK